MKNKILTFAVLSILSMVAVLGMASAAITLYPSSYSASIEQGSSGSFTFKIFNDDSSGNNYTLVNITSVVSDLVGSAGTLSSSAVSVGTMPSYITNETNSSNIAVSVNVPSSQAAGIYTGNITIDGKNNETGFSVTEKVIALSINVTPKSEPVSCEYGNVHDNLRIKKIEFTNNGFSGNEFGEDDEWFPIDEIQAEITIENRGDEKIEDIQLEWGLYDSSSGEWVIELDDEDDFDLKSDKSEVITINFQLDDADVDLEDLDEGTYVFYVIATGYDTEFEEDVCDLDSQEAELIIESDFVVLSEISVSETVSCGSELLVSAKVWNIGEDDQEDVYVNIYNKELKIDKDIEIGDVDAFSYERLDAIIAIPSDILNKTYNFVFSVYNEDDDIYENDYDDEESIFSVPIKITCSEQDSEDSLPRVVVSAVLESGGKAGENLVVKSTITNLESKSVTYAVSAKGYSDWASSASADQPTFTLPSGEAKNVFFTFTVKDDSSGEQTFDLEVVSGGKVVTVQPVSVEIEKKGFSLFQLFGNGNYLWVIALINIILVIAIIIVVIRIISK
jgi:hypothetical protein